MARTVEDSWFTSSMFRGAIIDVRACGTVKAWVCGHEKYRQQVIPPK